MATKNNNRNDNDTETQNENGDGDGDGSSLLGEILTELDQLFDTSCFDFDPTPPSHTSARTANAQGLDYLLFIYFYFS